MYLNKFADSTAPEDMTATDEFESLLGSAKELRVSHAAKVRCVSRNLVVNGLRFHALEWGEPGRQPLLLLHGGNQTAHSWDLVSLHFSDRFHIVALDQRGHGDSEWPRDGHAGAHEMASDAVAVLDQLGLRDPIIAGHSMGGIVTMSILRDYVGLARRAVVVDVSPSTSSEGTAYITRFITSIGEYSSIDEFVAKVAEYDPFRTREHITRTARYNLLQREDGKYVTKHAIGQRLASGAADRFREHAPTLDAAASFNLPVLLVRGESSTVITDEMGREFVRRLPEGRMVTVARCGHNVHTQNVLGFFDAVTDFILS